MPLSPSLRDITAAERCANRTVSEALDTLSLRASDSFASLGHVFHTRLLPQALPHPWLVCASPPALALLGFPADAGEDPAFIARFSGSHDAPEDENGSAAAPEPRDTPFASVYSGHQFGQWAGQLGDGRAISLGEMPTPEGKVELQLKGSGMTPYSRMGDGRAVLRSSIREFLCSEAMAALGIPTTRALCVTGSDLPVRRETMETAAVLTRFAPSFIRFGHFEHFWSTNQLEALRTLADHVITRFYPTLLTTANPYLALLRTVSEKTADMIAQWQSVGFCHGVMNTDNMSILGLTIDYGPFGFLDGFDAAHICNHTDQQGRYSYQNQPKVGYWNLYCLGQALLPLIAQPQAGVEASHDDADDGAPETESAAAARKEAEETAIRDTKAAIETFKPRYAARFVEAMRQKLGLLQAQSGDTELIDGLFHLLQAERIDFTLLFRRLAALSVRGTEGEDGTRAHPRDLFIDRAAFDTWCTDYRARLAAETSDDVERRAAMDRINPKFVLRNHLAEVAIRAAQQGDFSEVRRLLTVLQTPFDEHPDAQDYAALPPDWANQLEVSCSS